MICCFAPRRVSKVTLEDNGFRQAGRTYAIDANYHVGICPFARHET